MIEGRLFIIDDPAGTVETFDAAESQANVRYKRITLSKRYLPCFGQVSFLFGFPGWNLDIQIPLCIGGVRAK